MVVRWMGVGMGEIGLGEAIRALREELTEAKGEGEGSWMRFQIGQVDLELQLVVSKDARGQVGWKVLEVGGQVGSERTQKLSLTLSPQWWDAEKGQYTTDFLVSGVLSVPEAASDGASVSSPGVPQTDASPEDEE
jgi:hypothetical protein